MLYRPVVLFIGTHILLVGVNEDMTDVAACGTYTSHRGLNAECSLIHRAYCTNLPSSSVTAQFICRTLHPPVSAYYEGGHPPYQYPQQPTRQSSKHYW